MEGLIFLFGFIRRLVLVSGILLFGLVMPLAGAAVLVDSSPVTFAWNPAEGSIQTYAVFTSRDGDSYRIERYEDRTETSIDVDPGETLRIRVAAVGTDLDLGPLSSESEVVMLRSAEPAQSPSADSEFILVDSCANVDVRPLRQTDRVDIADFDGCFSVRLETDDSAESVRFWVNGVNYRTENVAPYAVEGDGGGNYHSWRKGTGLFLIEAVPFSGNDGSGSQGERLSIGLEVYDSRR